MTNPAPFAHAGCPADALRLLTPDALRHLDAYCRRAIDDPDATPEAGDEAAAVGRYYALLAARARRLHCRGEASR